LIKSLRVRNYLYIKDANLSFVSGINALIGESGVGKSVIVNILALPFGKKPAENPIGKWADKAEIEIIFLAQEQEYTLNIVIGSRVGFKLNEKVVSHEKIKDIWSKFLNIHSQGSEIIYIMINFKFLIPLYQICNQLNLCMSLSMQNLNY